MEENQFVDKCIEEYWGKGFDKGQVKIVQELADAPSEPFMSFFD